MTAYVDDLFTAKGSTWCHLLADSVTELHEFAAQIGVNRCWYHATKRHPHYDLHPGDRQKAIKAGAKEINRTELLKILRSHYEHADRS